MHEVGGIGSDNLGGTSVPNDFKAVSQGIKGQWMRVKLEEVIGR